MRLLLALIITTTSLFSQAMPINPLSLPGILADQIEMSDDADFAEALQTLADFERQIADAPAESAGQNHEHLAAAHHQLLEAFDDHSASAQAAPHLDALRRLHELHPANARIIEHYANALAHHHDAWLTGDDSDPARAAIPYQTLLALAEKNPAHDLSEEISDAHFNQIHSYLSRSEHRAAATIQTQLIAHHARHAANPHITQRLAQAHLTWVYSHVGADELARATEAAATLDAFVEKHLTSLPLEAQQTLRKMQIRALVYLVETSAERSNTGSNPAPSDPDDIAAAELHYAKLRTFCAAFSDSEIIAKQFADAAVALYNHYVLAAAPEPAAAKYRDLERLATRYPESCSAYFSRALYGEITSATREQRYADAEKHLVAFERLADADVQNAGARGFRSIPESTINLATATAALAHAYGGAKRMDDAERHSKKLAAILTAFPASDGRPSPKLLRLYADTLHNLVFDYAHAGDFPNAALRHTDLVALATQNPESASAAENLAAATDQLASALAKTVNIASAEKFLANHVPEILANNPDYSKTLYNLIVLASGAKDVPAAERHYATLRKLVQAHPPHTTAALRLAKAAYNLHYDYSDTGDFSAAESKYRDLQILTNIHANNPATENGNPIGLEIALRQANAARNYAVDLKNKKQSQRIPALLQDVRALAARWTSPAAKPIHDALTQITSLAPARPPPLPGAK